MNIEEMAFPSSIESISDDNDLKIFVKDGNIYFSGNKTNIEIYDTYGCLVYNGRESVISNLSKGIYIIKTANKTIKISI